MVKDIFFVILFNKTTNVGHIVKYGLILNFLLSVLPEELSVFFLLYFLIFTENEHGV